MRTPARVALVDAHVHRQPGIGWAGFLDGATRRFDEVATGLGLAGATIRFLLMTEAKHQTAFAEISGPGDPLAATDWTVDRRYDGALLLRRSDGTELVLVAGRQIETAEKLEVLALFTTETVADGLPLGESVRRVAATGAIPVLPWGFGKWWFGRGRILRSFLDSGSGERLFLGDNQGRPRSFPRSSIFRLATSKGIVTLPGSDPLPLEGQTDRAGSYGFVLDAEIDPASPADSLRAAILRLVDDPPSFGHRPGLLRALGTQIALRLRKRPSAN